MKRTTISKLDKLVCYACLLCTHSRIKKRKRKEQPVESSRLYHWRGFDTSGPRDVIPHLVTSCCASQVTISNYRTWPSQCETTILADNQGQSAFRYLWLLITSTHTHTRARACLRMVKNHWFSLTCLRVSGKWRKLVS